MYINDLIALSKTSVPPRGAKLRKPRITATHTV